MRKPYWFLIIFFIIIATSTVFPKLLLTGQGGLHIIRGTATFPYYSSIGLGIQWERRFIVSGIGITAAKKADIIDQLDYVIDDAAPASFHENWKLTCESMYSEYGYSVPQTFFFIGYGSRGPWGMEYVLPNNNGSIKPTWFASFDVLYYDQLSWEENPDNPMPINIVLKKRTDKGATLSLGASYEKVINDYIKFLAESGFRVQGQLGVGGGGWLIFAGAGLEFF